ncbi:App1 family protein [Roseimaritima sediminicola]|uniref:App1 family protein n=1 Tax=Roseimaritima sediminicola TaxID=2662066 RepID=UPI0012982F77|nr:phosphatase domain-containing protein [Roseimaritima sediminicola]
MPETTTESWRNELKSWVTRAASSVDDVADAGMRRLRKRLGRSGKPKIQAYRGYRSGDAVRVHGRILTNPPLNPDFQNDQWWHNLSNTVQRFASDEVPGVRIRAALGSATATAVSDAEGYFHLDLPCDQPLSENLFWSSAQLCIIDHDGQPVSGTDTTAPFLQVSGGAQYAVISDVDDTILHTGATDLTTMAKLTFFANARTRAPLEGVAGLYESLQHGGHLHDPPRNPIFYISSSPWNLYDLLEDFLELNAIPHGPLLLRDLGFDQNKFLKAGHEHKLHKAKELVERFEGLPFVLFGDSGQEDARLYSLLAEAHPSRIKAIFIRDIDPAEDSVHDEKVARHVRRSEAAGVPMHLVRDSIAVAELACQHGLLPTSAKEAIVKATHRDKQRKAGLV